MPIPDRIERTIDLAQPPQQSADGSDVRRPGETGGNHGQAKEAST